MCRLAFGMSKTGVLGLTARNTIKVAIPKKISKRLNTKHKPATHHINGLVLLLRGSRRVTLSFLGSASRPLNLAAGGFVKTIWLSGVDCVLCGVLHGVVLCGVLHGVVLGVYHTEDGVSHGGVSGGGGGRGSRFDMGLCDR